MFTLTLVAVIIKRELCLGLCVCLFITITAYSQTNERIIETLNPGKSSLLIKEETGEFRKDENSNTYWFTTAQRIKIGYLTRRGDKCDAFQINDQLIETEGKFDNDALACDLDLTSFKVFSFAFNKRTYLLLQVNNTGSGTSMDNVILNLFDITKLKRVAYFPLWSKFGSPACFGDFNKDARLDFLKISYYKVADQFRLVQQSIGKTGRFENVDPTNRFIIFQKKDGKLTVIKRKGFR